MSVVAVWEAIIETLRTQLEPLGVKQVDILRNQFDAQTLTTQGLTVPAVLVTHLSSRELEVTHSKMRDPAVFGALVIAADAMRDGKKTDGSMVATEIATAIKMTVARQTWAGKAFSAGKNITSEQHPVRASNARGLALHFVRWTQSVELSDAVGPATLKAFETALIEWKKDAGTLATDDVALAQPEST